MAIKSSEDNKNETQLLLHGISKIVECCTTVYNAHADVEVDSSFAITLKSVLKDKDEQKTKIILTINMLAKLSDIQRINNELIKDGIKDRSNS